MTMTESPPTDASAPAAVGAPAPVQGLYDWLSTSDHKVIGRLWLRVALIMLVAASALGVALAAERLDAASIDVFGGLNSYFTMWSLYRFGLVLLVAAPLFIGLATILVPMQVGSTNIAFPRLALASAWTYVLGAGITVVSVLARGGWGALDGVTADEADAIALTLLGTGTVIVAILMASVCVATTVVSLRTPGMSLERVPLFAWSMLVTAAVWFITLPVALANLALIYVDLRGGPLVFGDPEGSTLIYDQLAWVLEQPQIYAVAIPVLGIAGSIIPVVARSRHVAHTVSMGLIAGFGLFSIGGWSQPHFFDNTEDVLFVAFGLLIIVPVLTSLAAVAATLAGGESPVGVPPAPLLGAFGGSVVLLVATVAGGLRVIEPLGLAGTTVHTGSLNLVVGAAVVAGVGGIWFWAPKVNGRLLPAGQGLLVVMALLAGALLLGGADVVAGLFDAPDVMVTDVGDSAVDAMIIVSLVGALLFALGSLGTLLACLASLRSDVHAGDDPWDGHTLEWATATPPPAGNFAEPPARVVSEAPLLDLADAEGGES